MTIKIYDKDDKEIFSVTLAREPKLADVNKILELFKKGKNVTTRRTK